MGAKPLFALNIVGFPINTLPKDMLTTILQGGADKAKEAGIPIVGGHSIDDPEPKYGLVVTGEAEEDKLILNQNAKPGDVLILTKPLGTGIIATAIKKDIAKPEWIDSAADLMKELNKIGADVMHLYSIRAATDITGFGLLGHLSELCTASGVSAEISFNLLPFLPGVEALANNNVIPGGSKRNLNYAESFTAFNKNISKTMQLMTADAQTSGGLLVSCPENKVNSFIDTYNSLSAFKAVPIGRIIENKTPLISVIVDL